MLSLLNLAVLLLPFAAPAIAQTSTEELTGPSPAAKGTPPGPNTNGYTYVGCWNETTGIRGSGGVRALASGGMIAANDLTTSSCLNFCANATYQYCGMQYGRECWGAAYLNALSNKLDGSNCSFACQGNASEVCGGSLTITLFNLTGKATVDSGFKSDGAKKSGAARGPQAIFLGGLGADAGIGTWSSAVLSGIALLVMIAM